MNLAEAKTAVKAVYLQAASLSGLEVAPFSPERLAALTAKGFRKVQPKRRPEAVANMLRVIAATLDYAQEKGCADFADGVRRTRHLDPTGDYSSPR